MKKIECFLPLVFIFTIINSCDMNKTDTSNHKTFWVNSQKSKCDAGAGWTECISLSENRSFEDAEWRLFYSGIEGFNFESGIYQKIEVSVEHLDKENLPADVASVKYKLVKVLEKRPDPKIKLHDIWAAQQINGKPIDSDEKIPILEINITNMQILGSNGCNNYNGGIKRITASSIEFATIVSTRMMCPDMTIPDDYDKALNNSKSYKLEKLKLSFYDIDGNETLKFTKVD